MVLLAVLIWVAVGCLCWYAFTPSAQQRELKEMRRQHRIEREDEEADELLAELDPVLALELGWVPPEPPPPQPTTEDLVRRQIAFEKLFKARPGQSIPVQHEGSLPTFPTIFEGPTGPTLVRRNTGLANALGGAGLGVLGPFFGR